MIRTGADLRRMFDPLPSDPPAFKRAAKQRKQRYACGNHSSNRLLALPLLFALC